MAVFKEKTEMKDATRTESMASSKDPGESDLVRPAINFSLWQTLGMNFSITCAPLTVGAYLSLIVGLGGSPFYIWGILFSAVFQLITCIALAEIASAMPHSSGPAFWVQRLSPPKPSQFLGYLVGWTTNASWWFVAVANCLYMSQLALGLVQALNPGYTPRPWQFYLVYVAFALGISILNLPRLFKLVPHSLSWGIFIINSTALFILVSILVRASPKPSAREVFFQVVNDSGWPSNGVVFFLALVPGVISVFGFDATTHITDEVQNPSKQVPQVMIGSAALSAIAAFIMSIVYSFCVIAPENLLSPVAHQPIIQLIYDAERSDALTAIGIVGVILSFFIASVGCLTSWNRLYWSVSCGGGLPFPRTMSKLSSRDKLPLNALVVNTLLIISLGAIQLGSLTALNAVIGGAVICMTATYSLTFVLALWRGRGYLPQERWLNLGYLGMPLQITSLIWCIFISVWLCFPLYLPVTLGAMNWTSLVFVGIVACSVFYWFAFRRTITRLT